MVTVNKDKTSLRCSEKQENSEEMFLNITPDKLKSQPYMPFSFSPWTRRIKCSRATGAMLDPCGINYQG